jgi:hypothetical protein
MSAAVEPNGHSAAIERPASVNLAKSSGFEKLDFHRWIARIRWCSGIQSVAQIYEPRGSHRVASFGVGRSACWQRWPVINAANVMAAFIQAGSARFFPAMSNAIPWSAEVRTMRSPSVMFTVCSKSKSFSGKSAPLDRSQPRPATLGAPHSFQSPCYLLLRGNRHGSDATSVAGFKTGVVCLLEIRFPCTSI